MICSFYGDDAYSFPGKYSSLFQEAERILVLGPYMKLHLEKLGCSSNKLIIHHLGIDVHKVLFKKRSLKRNENVRLLIASGFVEKKGIDITIRALSAMAESYQFSLDIIGDGPLKNEIYAEAERSSIKDRITMHGFRPYEYFINLAYDCHVFIQASRTTDDNRKEGTPMAIVDAMATGLAVVSTKHSDIPEIVKDGIHGYLAEENSISDLQACIKKILDNPEKVEEFSVNGRQWIEKEFNVEIQNDRLENLYSSLIKADK